MGYFVEIGFDSQFCGQIEKIVFIQNLKNDTINKAFIEHIGIPVDKNCYINILGNAIETIMVNDGCGYGDMVACCPECEEPFFIPLKWTGNSYPCSRCGKLLKTCISNF